MSNTIAAALNKDVVKSKAICNVIGVLSFIILTAIGAYVRIPLPFTPVPITLQTFFVILSGAILGSRLGFCSQAGYLALGASGLPIFQNYASGLAPLAGPTAGYLVGFTITPLIIGKLISFKKESTFSWVVFAMAVGSIFILLSGTAYLMNFIHLGFKKGLMLGTLCFIPGDFVKTISAALIYKTLHKKAIRIFRLNSSN
ncbi:MAG: BioY family transporter [Candidatus Omnitrophica bacterium CG07_land_8_20_14_0_80_42_15]|uniref:Biotin transporter n=1 Tax=Candidatus Aquitaenariimonas noxiae TaxID=1974741 RepID=A0A2J0KTB1_9BACT|nr:MAG: BioY family transporter [Candidatus Omnitrophica bacterium CG07_land_8_20_14_0_80_42_15]